MAQLKEMQLQELEKIDTSDLCSQDFLEYGTGIHDRNYDHFGNISNE